MTSLKTSIKTITYLSDIGCLEIQGASLSTDIASLYYYRALVHFHNEKIEEARICIDKSLQLEPRRRKAVVIKECVDMYVPNPLKNNIKLYYKETESESHRVIIDNILKLKQLTRICMR